MRVKTQTCMELWNEFCEKTGTNPWLPCHTPSTEQQERLNATVMLEAIIAQRRGDWVPSLDDKYQERYIPVFQMTSAGLVFWITLYESWDSYSGAIVGAPFVYPTRKMAEEVAIEYLPIYEKYLGYK